MSLCVISLYLSLCLFVSSFLSIRFKGENMIFFKTFQIVLYIWMMHLYIKIALYVKVLYLSNVREREHMYVRLRCTVCVYVFMEVMGFACIRLSGNHSRCVSQISRWFLWIKVRRRKLLFKRHYAIAELWLASERGKEKEEKNRRGGRQDVRNTQENLNEFSKECHIVKIEA